MNDTEGGKSDTIKAMQSAKDFLGHVITVRVDRPLGSRHPQRGFLYPVNYGFVPDTLAADGEEVDAMCWALKRPCLSFRAFALR